LDTQAPTTPITCPRDGEVLKLQTYWKNPRHQCGECRGLFLGEANLTETMGAETLERAAAQEGGFVQAAHGAIATLPESSLACPRDATPMRALAYKGVEIDICPTCRSVWLDDGEYAKVAALTVKRIDLGRRERSGPDIGDPSGALDVVDFIGDAVGALIEGIGSL
jgi:Zn-finger nucleic acid-binding protein